MREKVESISRKSSTFIVSDGSKMSSAFDELYKVSDNWGLMDSESESIPFLGNAVRSRGISVGRVSAAES